MKCDVIIPVYNNPPTLPEAIRALQQQKVPPGWKLSIITADRGKHIDGGPGAARNQALDTSTGAIVLFLGADILLRPGALAQHLSFHTNHPAETDAALGMVKWDPRLQPSPLMEWMTHGGQQNDFDSLLGAVTADPRRFFYASHISLKRSIIGGQRFSGDFGSYGWEDLDLGRRLAQAGLQLHVLHNALALHHHSYSVSDIAERQQLVGRSADTVPPRSRLNHLRRRLFIALGGQGILQIILEILEHKFSTPRVFEFFTANQYWRGVWSNPNAKK